MSPILKANYLLLYNGDSVELTKWRWAGEDLMRREILKSLLKESQFTLTVFKKERKGWDLIIKTGIGMFDKKTQEYLKSYFSKNKEILKASNFEVKKHRSPWYDDRY